MNVLTNPGFETGDFTGWTLISGAQPQLNGPNSPVTIWDSRTARGAASGGDGTIEQIYTLQGGEVNYRLAAWMGNTGAGDPDNTRVRAVFRDISQIDLLTVELNSNTETSPFLYYEEETGAVPVGAVDVRVEVFFNKGSGGTANNGSADEIYLAFDEPVTPWTDGYNSKTVARLPLFTATGLTDYAPDPKSWRLTGNASIVTGGPHAGMNSVRFDGGSDSLVLESLTPRLDGGPLTSTSIIWWVALDDITQNQGLFFWGDPTQAEDRVLIDIDGTDLRVFVETGNTVIFNERVPAATYLVDGQWHMFELCFINQFIVFYLDGQVIHSAPLSDSLLTQQVMYFGAEPSPITGMTGNVADIWVTGPDFAISRQKYTTPSAILPLPGAVITSYPQDTVVENGNLGTFSVTAVLGAGTVTYQWEDENGPIGGETMDTVSVAADINNPQYLIRVAVTDDNGTVRTPWAVMSVIQATGTAETDNLRTALVWNFEDDNFTWMDASYDNGTTLDQVVCMKFQFNPGWAVTYQDQIDDGTTYQNLIDAGTTYQDLFSGGQEENIYALTADRIALWDQQVVTDGLKNYFIVRDKIDFSEIVPQFTSSRWIFARQMYFHLLSPRLGDDTDPNNVQMEIGWTDSLMDDAIYDPATVLNLQDRANNGVVKWDFRSTGRYMALRMNFNATAEIQMTGGEIDVMQTHGR